MNLEDGKDMGNLLYEGITDMVERSGYPVDYHSPQCTLWKAEHSNCKGCPAEVGCAKVVKLMLLLMLPMLYTPQSFEDFTALTRRVSELQDRVMEAKNIEEILAVPDA